VSVGEGSSVVEVDGLTSEQDASKQGSSSAPYMSFKGFIKYIEQFEAEGLPARFDASYFGNASGSLVAQVRGAFRALDLIDDDKHPTDTLAAIVQADDDERKALLRRLLEAKYPDALGLSANATSGQLADVFRARGLSGATVDKAISFYLGFTDYVDVAVSPHFKKGRAAASNGSGRRRRQPKPVLAATPVGHPTPVKPAGSAEQQRVQYVDMLMGLAKEADGETQTDLLDRIERALGFGAIEATPRDGVGA
jgi:hypothetical protein